MSQNDANQMVCLPEVEELLRKQAEAVDLKFQTVRDEAMHKHAEATHKLEMVRRDAEAAQRKHLEFDEALFRFDGNIQRTEALKQSLQKLTNASEETRTTSRPPSRPSSRTSRTTGLSCPGSTTFSSTAAAAPTLSL